MSDCVNFKKQQLPFRLVTIGNIRMLKCIGIIRVNGENREQEYTMEVSAGAEAVNPIAHHVLALCAMYKEVEGMVEGLCHENERLRTEVAELTGRLRSSEASNEQLRLNKSKKG